MKLVANAFRPWLNGSEQRDIFKGKTYGVPFVVRASASSWLPINLLVFAENEQDAIKRVKEGFEESIKATEERNAEKDTEQYYKADDVARYRRLLELMNTPNAVEVELYDPKYIARINWDSRGI